MEDHLLEIFNGHDVKQTNVENTLNNSMQNNFSNNSKNTIVQRWSPEALDELSRVPGFVRGKVKRNVEKFAERRRWQP